MSSVCIFLLILAGCALDSPTEFQEKEILLADPIELLRESFDDFDRIELVRDHEFEHALLLELTLNGTCCRRVSCGPPTQDEMEVMAEDIMLSYIEVPELKAFDGILLKINDQGIDYLQHYILRLPASRFR